MGDLVPLLSTFDPALAEAAQDDGSPREIAVIVRLVDDKPLPAGVRIVTRFGHVATVRAPRELLTKLAQSDAVAALEAARQLRLNDKDLVLATAAHLSADSVRADSVRADTVSADTVSTDTSNTDLSNNLSSRPCCSATATQYRRRPENLSATGRNVVVAVLDWGLDIAHPAFRHADGSTRLLALWDQRGDPAQDQRGNANQEPQLRRHDQSQQQRVSPAPVLGRIDEQTYEQTHAQTHAQPSVMVNRWGYGRILSAADINRALRDEDPYQALFYHPADADERDAESGQWRGAHGTHVMDIAAGNGQGGGLIGVAPQADLVFVHLAHTTRVLGPGNLGDSASVLEAIDFVFSIAGARPCVINMSVGAQGGPHDGSTLVEQGIDQAVWMQPGRAIVMSAGNYRGAHAHARGRLRAGETAVLPIHVPPNDPTDSELEIFYEAIDTFSVRVVAPDGEIIASLRPGQDSALSYHGVPIGHLYHRVRGDSNNERHVDLFLAPRVPGGRWRIELLGEQVQDGRYHAWIERERGPRPTFLPQQVDTHGTTGTLCNGWYSITVGAFNPHQEDWPLGNFSSAGPTRDGRLKPELVAPGVCIRAGRSTPRQQLPAARYTCKDGTSMAAPHVTGTVALMFEVAAEPLDIVDTRALLLGSTDCAATDQEEGTLDLYRRGFGYLNTQAAVQATAQWARDRQRRRQSGQRREKKSERPPYQQPDQSWAPSRAAINTAREDSAMNHQFERIENAWDRQFSRDSVATDTEAIELNNAVIATAESLTEPAQRLHWLGYADEPTAQTADDIFIEEISTSDSDTLADSISLDDVVSEMNGLRCRFLTAYTARAADGSARSFSAAALLPIEQWNGAASQATVAGFAVPKLLLAPAPESVAGVRRYDVALDAQRLAVQRNTRELADWVARESEFTRNRSHWQSEKTRLEDLLARRAAIYNQMWVRQMMYNRFDVALSFWTAHYNRRLSPATALDPNIVKSMLYQESRMGTHGAHLMPPPSDWRSSERHPIRSRFNIGQAIDSFGPQQWLMMQEMAPAIFRRHGLDAFESGRRWFGMSNADYVAHAPFLRALQEFFEFRDGSNRNLMGSSNRDLHEDYGFWIRTAIRWLFVKYSALRRPSWAEAVRAYNGSGSRAERYRDDVMARVGASDAYAAESLDQLPGAVAAEQSEPLVIATPTLTGLRPPLAQPSNNSAGDLLLQEDRAPSRDTSAQLSWEDLTRIKDSRGNEQLFCVLTGAPAGVAQAGDEGKAIFHLRVRNSNSVYNHKNVRTKYRVLDVLANRQFREVTNWQSFAGSDLEDESSRVIKFSLGSQTLQAAYNPDSPLTRLEVEYHWRETFEDYQEHYNTSGLDFVLVAPIEYLFGSKQRLTARDIELKDPALHKADYWIPVAGVNFTDNIRQPVTIQLDVNSTYSGTANAQQTTSSSQSRSGTQTRTTSNTFSLNLSGEVSQGGSAKATIDILELGAQQMFKLGASMGYSRTTTDTSSTTVAREFSRALSYSRSYSASQAITSRTTLTISPPEVVEPRGTGTQRGEPARHSGIGSVGVYLYPLVAFYEVPYVRFDGINRFGQATRRTQGKVAVPFVTEWRLTSHRGS